MWEGGGQGEGNTRALLEGPESLLAIGHVRQRNPLVMRAVHAHPADKEDRLSAPGLELQDLLHLMLFAAVGADDGGWDNDVAAERGRTSMETSQAVHVDLIEHKPLGREGQPIGVGRSNGCEAGGVFTIRIVISE